MTASTDPIDAELNRIISGLTLYLRTEVGQKYPVDSLDPMQALKALQRLLVEARLDQMHYVDQRLVGENTGGERVFYDKEAVIAENHLKDQQRIISNAMKTELTSADTKGMEG